MGKVATSVVMLAVALAAGAQSVAAAAEDPGDVAARADVAFAAKQLGRTAGGSPTAYPVYTGANGQWVTKPASNWTSGFTPGALWLLYQATGDPAWKTRAVKWQAGVRSQAANTGTHDVGFQIGDSFGLGARLTSSADYRAVALQGAASLATRYDPRVGMVRSWKNPAGAPADDFRVIVDGLMNHELLFWAAKHGGDPALAQEAASSALRTAQDFVRPDGSVYHMVIYDSDTGAIKTKTTANGYADESTWSRGQAWAIHGFAIAYRETGDVRLLDAARRTAAYFMAHLPADGVPPWDFDAPAPAAKDSSAAAIAAAGLAVLARAEPDADLAARDAADARSILARLSGPPYLVTSSPVRSVLLHGDYSQSAGVTDSGLSFGDFYLLEALMAVRQLPPATPALPIVAVRASASVGTDVAANAVDGDPATAWSAKATSWLRLDLGAPRTVTKVTVADPTGDQRASRLSIQTSSNGSSFTTRATVVTSGASRAPETYDVPDVTARYVRILGLGSATDALNHVSEVTVH